MGVRPMRPLRVPSGVPAGVLATVTMDVAMVAAGSLGGSAFTSDRLGPDMIGRWAAGLLRGRWRRSDISREPAQRGELALGLATHYATGVALTQAFLLTPRRWSGRRSFLTGTAYGISTAVLPLVMMFPSMGYGWFGLRSGEGGRLNRIMLVGHVAFGVGIGLWAPRFRGAPAASVTPGGPVSPGTAESPAPTRDWATSRTQPHGPRPVGVSLQPAAFLTSSAIRFSPAAVRPVRAKATGHISPSSSLASGWKPRVE
jgi:hypothetical protein